MPQQPAPTAPAIGISFSYQLGEAANFVLQTFVPVEASETEFNAALDRLTKAAHRQSAQMRLPQAKRDLERRQRAYFKAAEDVIRIDAELAETEAAAKREAADAGRRGAKLNPAQERAFKAREADRANTMTTLERGQQDIDRLQEEVAELERAVDPTKAAVERIMKG